MDAASDDDDGRSGPKNIVFQYMIRGFGRLCGKKNDAIEVSNISHSDLFFNGPPGYAQRRSSAPTTVCVCLFSSSSLY